MNSSNPNADSTDSVKNVFENLWSIIAAFTRGFVTVYGISHSLPALEPEIEFKSVEDAARSLPGFFTLVSGLQEGMFRCLKDSPSAASIEDFHSKLVGFRGSLAMDQSFWPPLDTSGWGTEHYIS